MSAPLRARVVPAASLGPAARDAMYALFEGYYACTSRDRFEEDLAGKDHVILLAEAGTGVLRGFSTLRRVSVEVGGRSHRGVFSGDTVVSREHWGGRVLGRAFLRYMFRERLRAPLKPLHWVLISKGYKTYLLMANNFAEHWPRPERPTPEGAKALMDAFGRRLFGAAYDPARGVVDWPEPYGQLRPGVASVSDDLRQDNPRVAFFARANPTWERGTELMCLARMDWSMPLVYAWKAWALALARRRGRRGRAVGPTAEAPR